MIAYKKNWNVTTMLEEPSCFKLTKYYSDNKSQQDGNPTGDKHCQLLSPPKTSLPSPYDAPLYYLVL